MLLAQRLKVWRRIIASWLLALLAGCTTQMPAPAQLQTECPKLAIPPALLIQPPTEPSFQKALADYFSPSPSEPIKSQPTPPPVSPGSGD